MKMSFILGMCYFSFHFEFRIKIESWSTYVCSLYARCACVTFGPLGRSRGSGQMGKHSAGCDGDTKAQFIPHPE